LVQSRYSEIKDLIKQQAGQGVRIETRRLRRETTRVKKKRVGPLEFGFGKSTNEVGGIRALGSKENPMLGKNGKRRRRDKGGVSLMRVLQRKSEKQPRRGEHGGDPTIARSSCMGYGAAQMLKSRRRSPLDEKTGEFEGEKNSRGLDGQVCVVTGDGKTRGSGFLFADEMKDGKKLSLERAEELLGQYSPERGSVLKSPMERKKRKGLTAAESASAGGLKDGKWF